MALRILEGGSRPEIPRHTPGVEEFRNARAAIPWYQSQAVASRRVHQRSLRIPGCLLREIRDSICMLEIAWRQHLSENFLFYFSYAFSHLLRGFFF